jgi:hypothetical protein
VDAEEHMTITLPDELRPDLERRAHAAGFATASEYVCWLVQQPDDTGAEPAAQDLGFADGAALEAHLIASLDSGPVVPVTPDFWNELRKEVAARADQKTGPQ